MNKKMLSTVLFLCGCFVIGTVFVSCASPGEKSQADEESDQMGGATEETQGKQNQEGQQGDAKKQEKDKWGNRLVDSEKQESEELTKNEKEARALLKAARRHYELGEYDKARDALEKSLEKDPSLTESQQLLNDVLKHQGKLELEEEAGQSILDRWKATKEQLVKKTQQAFKEGKKAMDNEKYARAVDLFREVKSRIKFMPTVGPNLKDLRNQSEQFLKTAMKKKKEQERERKRKAQRAMQKMAETEEYRRRQSRKQRIKRILERARVLFENKDYKGAENLLEEAEKMDPTIQEVKELKRIAWRLHHRNLKHKLRVEQRQEYLRWHRNLREKMLPQPDVVSFPDEQKWERINKRPDRGLQEIDAGPSEEAQEVLNTLRNRQINVDFTDRPLQDVIALIRKVTNQNIIIDREAIPNPQNQPLVNLSVQNLPAMQVLELIMRMNDLSYRFDEGVMVITKGQRAQNIQFQIYDIQDLDLRIQDFPAEAVALSDIEQDAGGGGLPGTPGDQPTRSFAGDELRDLIQQVIEPQSWQGGRTSIQFSDGLLLVRNTPDVHKKIKALLENVRKATGMLVNIRARFLEVRRSFLERLSTEFGGLGQPDIDEFTSGTVGSGSDFTQLTPGIFNDDPSQNEEMKALTDHSFGSLTATPFQSINLAGFQGSGGTMLLGVFNDVSANAIIQAVQKDSKATEVTAPQVTLFNNQRGHVAFKRQITYIRDQDPQVATGAVIGDPDIDIINDRAFVLDVRPIVSANRKYITIELQPTIAELVQPIRESQINTTIGVSLVFGAVTGVIELPLLEVKKTQNTVAIPDGGSVVIGGLATSLDSTRKSEVPVLGDIPIAGVLGRDRQDLKDAVEVIAMVRGKVVIMEELERLRFESSTSVSPDTPISDK